MKWNNWYLLHSNVKPWTFHIKLEPYICTVWSVNDVPAKDLPETHQDWIPAKYSNPKVFPSGQYIAMQCCKTGNLHLPETLWWVTGCLVQHQEISCYVNSLNFLTQIIFAFFAGDNSEGCLGDNYCPPECTCTGTVVRCSHAKLKEIPNGIPRETSELYLDVNEINSIDTNRLKHLKALSRL